MKFFALLPIMGRKKGQNNRFPLNTYLAIKRNQDLQLARALANDKNYVSKAKKLKRLQSKVGYKIATSNVEFS